MAYADTMPMEAGDVIGKVSLLLRGHRLIDVGTGYRENLKQLYAWLSLRNLTWGVLKSRTKHNVRAYVAGISTTPRKVKTHNYRDWMCRLIAKGATDQHGLRIDGRSLEMAALHEGVAGVLYSKLKIEADAATGKGLRSYYQAIAARNIAGLTAVVRLEEDLQKSHIIIMLLKGASLLDTIYTQPGLRMMEDIDIIVRPDDMNRFCRLLEKYGYQAQADRVNCYQKGLVILDLHTDALNTDRVNARRWLLPAGMPPVWQEAVPWKEGLHQIKKPADVDNILLLTQHALKHGFSRLIWLVDIWLLLKNRSPTFWEQLYTRAEQLHQLGALYQALFLLEREFELVVPVPFNPPAEQISLITRMLLLTRLDGKKDAHTGVLLPLLSIQGFKRRLAFAVESTFLKPAVARQEFGSVFKSRPAFIFYLHRLGFAATQAWTFTCLTVKFFFHSWGD